jgi:hypothetical protein
VKKLKINDRLITVILVAILVAGVACGVAFAAYLLTSNHVAGTPSAQATLTLTPSTPAPVSGVNWTLTAHVSDNLAGLSVALQNNGALVESKQTDASGNAVFTVAPTAAFDYVATATHS